MIPKLYKARNPTFFYKEFYFHCIFKDFYENLDYLTLVSLRSFFIKNNLVSLGLRLFADFVRKQKRLPDGSLFCITN